MVLIGTTDLENVPNALRFHAEHKEHCLGLYEQNTRYQSNYRPCGTD